MNNLMPKLGRVVLIVPSVFFLAFAMNSRAVVPGDAFNANNAGAITTLQQWYNASGQWNSTGWWNAANCIDAVESGMVANNGQNYLGVLTNTFKLNSGGNFLDG